MSPLKKPEHYTATVTRIRKGRELQILNFECDRPVSFVAGQFLMLELPTGGQRGYSIASKPVADSSLELIVGNVVVGKGTQYLCSLKTGDQVNFLAPLGMFGFLDAGQDETFFIATGAGIASLRSIYTDRLSKGFEGRMRVVYGSRFEENMLYKNEMEALAAAHPNFTFENVLSRPSEEWTGKKGYVTDVLKTTNLNDGKKRLFFLCGRQEMIKDVREYLKSQGIPNEQIRFESYG